MIQGPVANPTAPVVALDIRSRSQIRCLQNTMPQPAIRPGLLKHYKPLRFFAGKALRKTRHDQRGSRLRSLAFLVLVFTFSAVMALLADLDRPGEGVIGVSQRGIVDLGDTMDLDH